MPIVNVKRDDLFERIGENFGATPKVSSDEVDKKFGELCFRFGIELDDVTSEQKMKLKETNILDKNVSDETIYKIDVPANRYDLLCLEGLSRSLRVFLGKQKAPVYKVEDATKTKLQKMVVKKEVESVRPVVVCAVLRNLHFNETSYQSFIDLQEKLHQNICRKRSLVSIGTHDLDTLEGPFTYEAVAPEKIRFVPLEQSKEMNAIELFAHIEKNSPHLKPYLHLIRDSPLYPVIYDSKRRVLSLPPIINGDHSKITLNTKNVFIEVTAIDKTKADVVLSIMCTMFAEYCKDAFCVEPVEVVDEVSGDVSIHPNLAARNVDVSINYINKGVGLNLKPTEMADVLGKMGLEVQGSSGDTLTVSVPCIRSDILHPCDIMEDVAIGYGYDNLEKKIPDTYTEGKPFILNKVSDFVRQELAMCGYTEVLTFALCSSVENFEKLNKKNDGSAVILANPVSKEFDIARTTLLPGVLNTVKNNRSAPLPIKIFEVSDVVVKTSNTDVGAMNKRHLCAVFCANVSSFETIHGLLDRVMFVNRVGFEKDSKSLFKRKYKLQTSDDATFFEGSRADIILDGKKVGTFGVVHPQVLLNYEIPHPCVALEMTIEPFV